MKRSPRQQILYLLSFLVAAVPFAFALIRAFQTGGSDLRYLWMAIASFVAATAVVTIGRARTAQPNVPTALSVVAFVVAALAAGLTGYLLGARAASGIGIVSIAFALCWAASRVLRNRSSATI